MENNSRYPIVRVLWNDASSDVDEWHEEDDLDDGDEIVTTVGFLVKETKKFIWVACSTYEKYSNGRMKIPLSMIVSREVLVEGKQ